MVACVCPLAGALDDTLSTLQLMHCAMPYLVLIEPAMVPLLDPTGVTAAPLAGPLLSWLLLSCGCAVAINLSTTLVLGVTSPLALVLLGQLKTGAGLLAGASFYDATPSAASVGGAATAILSIGTFTLLAQRRRHAPMDVQASVDEERPLATARSPTCGFSTPTVL